MKFLTAHLKNADEGYFEHLFNASRFGIAMIVGGVACLLHAILPFVFVKTGSNSITRLHDTMVTNRKKHPIGNEETGNDAI